MADNPTVFPSAADIAKLTVPDAVPQRRPFQRVGDLHRANLRMDRLNDYGHHSPGRTICPNPASSPT